MKSSLWFVAVACLLLAGLMFVGCENSTPTGSAPASFGRFEGEVVASWDNDGRNMTLRQPFGYIDSQNRVWAAPAGSVVNGASIPYGFWSIIGGPFEGQYRNASVVHDVGCHEMTASWQDVHRMFYEACRCGGVDESRAKLMYYAVYHFGPRWETVEDSQLETTTTPDGQLTQREVMMPTLVRIDPPPPTAEEVEQATALIKEENPAPAVIEQTNREVLRRRPRGGGYGSGGSGTGGYAKRPSGSADGFASPRLGDGQPNWQRPNDAPAWNGERHPNHVPNQFAANSPRPRPAPEPWNSDATRNAPQGQHLAGQRPGPNSRELSSQETEWAEGMVRQHLERQTGEQRPAQYNVSRTDRGYNVQVQYLQLDGQGQPVANTGSSTLRLGRDGRVMEMINRY